MSRNMPPGDKIWLLVAELACESPIEKAFLHAVVQRAADRQLTAVTRLADRIYPVTPILGGDVLQVYPQVEVGPYRFDFLLTTRTSESVVLVVECDGHEFHERTKEQAAKDRARDRRAQQWGAVVFRFTGSELHHDANACADQCIDLLLEHLYRDEPSRGH